MNKSLPELMFSKTVESLPSEAIKQAFNGLKGHILALFFRWLKVLKINYVKVLLSKTQFLKHREVVSNFTFSIFRKKILTTHVFKNEIRKVKKSDRLRRFEKRNFKSEIFTLTYTFSKRKISFVKSWGHTCLFKNENKKNHFTPYLWPFQKRKVKYLFLTSILDVSKTVAKNSRLNHLKA